MRPIKFRTYDKDTGKFHFWGFVRDGFSGPQHTNGVMLRECEQFTGLLDKNGKEIYEGDIVKATWHEHEGDGYYNHPIIGSVFFDPDWGVKIQDKRTGHQSTGSMWRDYHKVEVIGNIHENPELLTP